MRFWLWRALPLIVAARGAGWPGAEHITTMNQSEVAVGKAIANRLGQASSDDSVEPPGMTEPLAVRGR
jgi:hypothetical protein